MKNEIRSKLQEKLSNDSDIQDMFIELFQEVVLELGYEVEDVEEVIPELIVVIN